MSLSDIIQKKIREKSALGIDEYMALALGHPDWGYYMRKDPLGTKGDFTTASEISQMFGELLGAWIAHQWMEQGAKEAIWVELGPGRGTLMGDALRATKGIPGFHEKISIHLVEMSPVLKAAQRQTLKDAHPRIEWHSDISTLPPKPLFFVANEFFDALPIRQFIGNEERKITLNDKNEFCFMPESGEIRETCEAAEAVLKSLCNHIKAHGGGGLIIDYGYASGQGDTLQAMKDHHYWDVLKSPGEADITAHVDFGALKKIAEKNGVITQGPIEQGTFLASLGITTRARKICEKASNAQKQDILAALERLTSPDKMGALFKVLVILQDA